MNNNYIPQVAYGGNGNTPPAIKEPRVPQKLGALFASLELLEKSLAVLGDRLSSVSIPAAISKEPSTLPQEPCLLAEQLQTTVLQVERIRNHVDEMTARLEI